MDAPKVSDALSSLEARRLVALERYGVLDTAPEGSFDRLTRLAARVLQMPIVLVSLVDDRRQWFKSCHGLDLREMDRSASFCVHALESDDVLIVPDVLQDERFSHNPLVLYPPHVRFYAGAPLITPEGLRLGTLCVLDTAPHKDFSADEQATLQELAASVMSELELRAALADRRHSEAISAAVLAASPDGIVTLDDTGIITTWNKGAEQIFGYRSEEMLGRSSRQIVSEINDEAVSQQFWAFLQAQALQHTDRFMVPVCRRDRSTFPGEITVLTLEVDGQRLYTLLIRDLTAQEVAHAELVAQRNLLRAALDGVPEAMYVKDAQRRFLMINQAGASQLGLPVEAILGRTDEEVQPFVVAAATRKRDEQVLATGRALSYEVSDVMHDGQTRVYWSSKTAYRDTAGQIAGLIGVSVNITERKAAEAKIQQHNDLLAQRAEEAQLEILERLARAAEYRDDDTGGHMLRVGTTAAGLARELGLTASEVDLIRRTAPLHDVGKIGISDRILLKPGRLTPEEFELVKAHCMIGAGILQDSQSELVKMAETIARTHHERWDGAGYPAGLATEAIPLAGRIVAVADVLDALTSERPYKQAWSLPAAIAEIQTQAGRQFDPQVVLALHRLYLGAGAQTPERAPERPTATGGGSAAARPDPLAT